MWLSSPHLNPIFFSQESLFLGFSSTAWTAFGSIGVIVTVLLALFGKEIKSFLYKPKLKFAVVRRCPQALAKKGIDIFGLVYQSTGFYFMYRILVKNIGKSASVDVRALIEEINGKKLILPIPLK